MSIRRAEQHREETTTSAWPVPGPYQGDESSMMEAESPMVRLEDMTRRRLATLWAACGAFEWVALGYLAVTSVLIALFTSNVKHPLRLLGAQAGVAALLFFLSWAGEWAEIRRAESGRTLTTRWWHFWRHWYPHLFFLFCFEELAYLMRLIRPDWQDAKLIAFDYWLTGVNPSVWLEQFATPFRNDAMQLIYFTYFTYLLIVGGVFYFRKEWQAYWSVMTYSMVGYSIGYLIAIFFPIESPWFSMAGWWKAPLAGGPFTAIMNFIEHYGRVRGAAFPSAHVTGATAALWGAWKYRRWLFWAMLPFFAGMCMSTVWGRYHYAADVFAGMITGALGYGIGNWIMKSKNAVATVRAKAQP